MVNNGCMKNVTDWIFYMLPSFWKDCSDLTLILAAGNLFFILSHSHPDESRLVLTDTPWRMATLNNIYENSFVELCLRSFHLNVNILFLKCHFIYLFFMILLIYHLIQYNWSVTARSPHWSVMFFSSALQVWAYRVQGSICGSICGKFYPQSHHTTHLPPIQSHA